MDDDKEPVFDYMVKEGNIQTVMIDRKSMTDQYISAPNFAIPIIKDEDAVEVIRSRTVKRQVVNNGNNNKNNKSEGDEIAVREFEGVIWVQLLAMQDFFQDNRCEENEAVLNDENFIAICKQTNKNITNIINQLGENSLVVAVTGQPNFRYYAEFVFFFLLFLILFSNIFIYIYQDF